MKKNFFFYVLLSIMALGFVFCFILSAKSMEAKDLHSQIFYQGGSTLFVLLALIVLTIGKKRL